MNKVFLVISLIWIMMGCKSRSSETINETEILKVDTVIHIHDKTSPSLKLQLYVEMPKVGPNKEVSNNIQTCISKSCFCSDTHQTTHIETLKQYVKRWEKDYKSLEADFLKLDSLQENYLDFKSFNWEVGLKGKTHCLNDRFISYIIENTSILDGSSTCSSSVRGLNISFYEGRELSLDDLFNYDYEESLLPIIISQIKETQKISSSNILETSGFFAEEEICVSQNFILNNEGLTFIYNPGEIAASFIGVVYVNISYDKLAFAMKDGCLLKSLIKH